MGVAGGRPAIMVADRALGARWLRWGLPAALVLLAVAWWSMKLYAGGGAAAVLAARSSWSLMGAAPGGASAPPRPLAAVRAKVLESGVLQGTQVAGDWAVGADGRLHPSVALRQRFEYYLLGLGDASPQELRALIEEEARAAHGPKLAAAIMAIFDQYWALRMQQPRYPLNPLDRSTWGAALAEQKAVRRQFLGPEWAQAFFADEEAYFEQTMAQVDHPGGVDRSVAGGQPVPQLAPGKDAASVRAERVALYGEAAAQRLERADAEWADWERRRDAAQAEWQRLSGSAELSAPQRQQAMEQYVQAHFKSDERLRVRALLDLP